MRPIVSGNYYSYTNPFENTFVTVARPSSNFIASTDHLTSNTGVAITGISATVLRSTSGSLSNSQFSSEFTGFLPPTTGINPSQPGNYILRSTSITSYSVNRIDINNDRIIDYNVIEIKGLSNLLQLNRPVLDSITGDYNASSLATQISSNVSFRARFIDYDVPTNEPLSGVYGLNDSQNGLGINGNQIDQADIVLYRPGSTTSAWISTDGYDPIKSSFTSPLDTLNPLSQYQPNVWS